MKKVKTNFWKSTLSGQVYEMPDWWLPQYPGWELIHGPASDEEEQEQEED